MTEEQKQDDERRYLVVLFEVKGAPLDADESPFAVVANMPAEGPATDMAREMALSDPQDRAYAVYQKVGTARAAREVTWKGARP